MDIDRMLAELNRAEVDCLLIGGVNFLLRHQPVLTFDVDVWIEPSAANRTRCEKALAAMEAEWGATEASWGPVAALPGGWLGGRPVHCLATAHGALDVFLSVRGLPDWAECAARAVSGETAGGVPYRGLCDADMLRCQQALPEGERKLDRIAVLRRAIEGDIT